MIRPNNLVLVRHGESEGNLANGDTKETIPNKEWELTDRGILQASCAGVWLQNNFPDGFDEYRTSPLVRSVGTAFHLGIEDAEWQMDDSWRERSSGEREFIDPKIRESAEFREAAALRFRSTYETSYPGAETDADVAARVRSGLDDLSDSDADKSVLVVTHGHLMRAAQMEIEGITGMEWMERDLRNESWRKIRNAQALHFTGIDPETGEHSPDFSFVRAVRTWRESGKQKLIVPDNKLEDVWHRIERRRYTQDGLAKLLEHYRGKRDSYLAEVQTSEN